MSAPPTSTSGRHAELAVGSDVLVVDVDAKVRAGLEQLLREAGLHVTALGDDEKARRLIGERFFSVVVADFDTPSPGEGLSLVGEVQERSPASAVILLCARKVFEDAVRAFRSGVADIIPKAPDQVEYVRRRVLELAGEARVDLDRRKLLVEAHEVHEEFLRRMMETARKVIDLEERLGGRPSGVSPSDAVATSVLIADDAPAMFAALKADLAADAAWWTLRHAQSGGEALDVASNELVHIALIKEGLPDLPGSMVVRTLMKTSPATLAVVFSASGQAQLYDGSRAIPLELGSPEDTAARVRELRDALRIKNRERRYLQAFRAQHYDFLRKYADLKHKLEKILK